MRAVDRDTAFRALGAAAMLAGAVFLWQRGGTPSRVGAVVLVVDVATAYLPWSIPRARRSGRSYWAETLVYSVPILVAAVVAIAAEPSWVMNAPTVAWLAAGVGVGACLVALSRMDLAALVRGDLAFLVGPDKPSHAAARASSVLTAPAVEETFFRGLVLAPGAATNGSALVSTLAFVGRHRLLRGMPDRARPIVLLTETAAAIGFAALTLLSGSIYAAVVAHLVANAPMVTLDLQVALQKGH